MMNNWYPALFLLIVFVILVLIFFFHNQSGSKIDPYEARLAPPQGVTSNGSGNFVMTPTPTADPKTWNYTLNYQNLTGLATVAHIHYTSNKQIAYPINVSPTGHATGTVTFKDSDLPLRNSGQFYINVHTARYPDGEISGGLVYIP